MQVALNTIAILGWADTASGAGRMGSVVLQVQQWCVETVGTPLFCP